MFIYYYICKWSWSSYSLSGQPHHRDRPVGVMPISHLVCCSQERAQSNHSTSFSILWGCPQHVCWAIRSTFAGAIPECTQGQLDLLHTKVLHKAQEQVLYRHDKDPSYLWRGWPAGLRVAIYWAYKKLWVTITYQDRSPHTPFSLLFARQDYHKSWWHSYIQKIYQLVLNNVHIPAAEIAAYRYRSEQITFSGDPATATTVLLILSSSRSESMLESLSSKTIGALEVPLWLMAVYI